MDTTPKQPIKLYRHRLSGHCHRVELLLSILGLRYEIIDVDLRKGEHKQPWFLAMNALGQVPVIDDAGAQIADSNGILMYLALQYGGEKYAPATPQIAAQIQRWLSIAAGPIVTGPGAARRATVFGAQLDHEAAKAASHQLFKIIDHHLHDRAFLTGEELTIADLACYSYIAHAPEGGVSLAPYAYISAWIERIESLKNFVPMPRTQVGLLAP